MNRLLLATLLALTAVAALAQDEGKPLDAKLERAVRDVVANCSDLKLTRTDPRYKLPARFAGSLIRMESKSHACSGQMMAVVSPSGGFFLGMPWYIANEEGTTVEQKLKSFAWRNLQENVTPVIDRKPTIDGLWKVSLIQTTAAGKVSLDGEMDPEGTVFFFGHFRRMNGDMRAERLKMFEPVVATSPTRGGKDATVTIIEFSDFECPSCKYAAGYVDPIITKHGDKVRYVRYDLPLSGHPWSFPAAMAGRAIYRQKPELFWEYKKQVYANQDKLSTFTFDDFARNFATSHDLDLKKYDADLASEEIKNDVLKGIGLAFTNDIRATPSYMVNGVLVEYGANGKGLADYVDSLLTK